MGERGSCSCRVMPAPARPAQEATLQGCRQQQAQCEWWHRGTAAKSRKDTGLMRAASSPASSSIKSMVADSQRTPQKRICAQGGADPAGNWWCNVSGGGDCCCRSAHGLAARHVGSKGDLMQHKLIMPALQHPLGQERDILG